ncbi:MAG: glycoside hydrolase N-terminal domain-containing protein, partial [Oscillospiraceae bacterium]|nr:glycoside hydrolase N-terminal domain-containing protein [Oscillospiraceae bacterium]
MNILKKIAAVCVAATMVVGLMPISAIPIQASAAEGNSLRLWYDEPASQGTNILSAGANYSDADGSNTWQQQTLPIGSGDMGANVYGEIVSEHLTFNEKTLWTGGPSSSRPDYMGGNVQSNGQNGAIMQQVQELFLAGRTSEAVSLCNQLVGTSTGYGAYQPWGDIWFDYSGISTSVTNYQRDLDLTTGIASVSFTENGTEYTREYFISHDDNVLVARLEANGSAKLNLNVRFTSKQSGTTVAQGNNTLVLNGQVSDNQLKYASYLTVVPEGGSVTGSGSTLTVANADAITVYVSAATDYKNTFWNDAQTDDYYYRTGETDAELAARVLADVNAAVENGYETVKASHLADYQELFNRVELDLGQTVSSKTTDQLLAAYKNGSASEAEKRQLEVMLFQYGRYLTIASSREDSQLPSNLQGVWNFLNNPPWASDYHMNVNLQMNYWPTYSTNLAECAMPLIDYVDSLREPGRITAKIYNGADVGFSAHTQNTPFGWTCPGWAFSWGWSPAAVPWILQNCWEYYEYTGDVAFMEEYLYPMMKEEAQFYDAILIEDADGKLVSAPAYSPEHGPYTLGNTYEQSLVWQLYEDVVIAAETLGVDEELVAQWKANQSNLKGPIEVGDSGQLKEWYEETTIDSMNSQGADAAGHRHLSHMLGLFPGDLVQRNPEWVAAAKVSMDYRTDNSTGWGMGQRINTWARLGEGNKAHELIGNLFKGGIYPNLWDSHAPFQIDGNFGMTSGVAEMLMQSNMGFINLLPALPDAWAEGSVSGLVARGNFEISMDWTKGGITKATIESKNGGEAVILADNVTLATVTDGSGNEVDYTVTEDGKIAFDTVEGETYTLSIPERPDAPTNLAVVRDGLQIANLTWDAVDGASYNVYRASGAADPVLIASELTETAYIDEAVDTEAASVTYYVTAVMGGIESIYSGGVTLTAPAGFGMIDNLDQRIAYAGGWANWSESVNYNGSIMYLEGSAYSTDATVTLQFIGTGIEVITCTNHDRSYMEVIIDGVSCGEVDSYSASAVRQKVIFSKDDLEYGLHTIVLKPMEKNNPSCSRNGTYKLELDAFNVIDAVANAPEPGEVNLEVGESVTLTDDTGYYVGTDVSALDTSVATVEITGEVTSYEKALSEKVTGVNDGKTYVFYNKVAGKLMNNQWADASVGGGGSDGLALSSTLENFQDNDGWTVTAAEGGWYVQDVNGKYLSIARGKAQVKDEPVVISLDFDGTDWTIGENGEYANDFGGAHSAVAGWSDINDTNSQWEIYEVVTTPIGTTTITFTGVGAGETSVQIGNVLYTVTVTEPYTDPADDSRDIPLDVLEVSAGDWQTGYESSEGPAALAVDNNPNTLWHTDWYGTSIENHWFQFELTEGYTVDGLRYWPRQAGNTNGTITEYEIQVSNDGETFETVATGSWEGDRNWKIAQFDGQNVKYVRLVSLEALTDNQYVFASASEIRLTGEKNGDLPHEHSWSDWAVTTEPTCTETGVETRTCECGETETRTIAALGHTEEILDAVEPTCNETGLTEGKKCSVCGEIIVAQEVVPALGHDFVDGKCTRCDEVQVENPFTDVPEGSFYFDSVLWAVEQGITSGTTATTFTPDRNVTRAEAVTFLWRAKGSPEPTSATNPFEDVPEDAFYYKAVLWAVENGITNGVSATRFGSMMECDRSQVV